MTTTEADIADPHLACEAAGRIEQVRAVMQISCMGHLADA